MGSGVDAQRESGTTSEGVKYVKWGNHIDTMDTVNAVFAEQRKLSFMYGAAFFAVTLAIPALSVWVPAWYAQPIWGGMTANYFVVSILYFVFLWVMAWTYSKQADKLDDRLMHLADESEKSVAVQKDGGAS